MTFTEIASVEAASRALAATGCLAEPGVGETLVWTRALLAVGDGAKLEETLGRIR